MSELMDLHEQIVACSKCGLSRSRTRAVPGAGDPETRLMFVGEAPGFHEDHQGLPFVGAAGRLLDELLGSIGLDRSEVFITNIIKCRPPSNRDPLRSEIEACSPYLDRQVELINPEIIATLGRFSMAYFLGAKVSISRIHGQPQRLKKHIIYPLFHPAAALRQKRFSADLQEDFQRLRLILADELHVAGEEEEPEEPPAQLSLF